MGEIVPGVSVLAIIFPDRAPLALAQVGTPTFPVLSVIQQSSVFGCLRHCRPLSFLNTPVFLNSFTTNGKPRPRTGQAPTRLRGSPSEHIGPVYEPTRSVAGTR